MQNIGFGELLIILLIVMLLVGAKRLPELGRSLGEAIREFKKGAGESSNDKKPGDDKKS